MRLKVDLSLHNSQHFTIWNKITQGPHSARSVLHAPPRWKAGGWSDLKACCDCISQVRGCWRGAPALSQQCGVILAVLAVVQNFPASAAALGKVLAEEALLTSTLLLFSHFHKGCNYLPLGEHSLGCPENDRQVVLPGIYRDHTIWTWEVGKNWNVVPNTCIKAHVTSPDVPNECSEKTKDLRN